MNNSLQLPFGAKENLLLAVKGSPTWREIITSSAAGWERAQMQGKQLGHRRMLFVYRKQAPCSRRSNRFNVQEKKEKQYKKRKLEQKRARHKVDGRCQGCIDWSQESITRVWLLHPPVVPTRDWHVSWALGWRARDLLPQGKHPVLLTSRATQGSSMETASLPAEFQAAGCGGGREPSRGFAAEYFRADQSYNKLNPQFHLSPSEVNMKQHFCTARTFLHNKTLPLLCAGTCIDATNILASRHRAVRGHVSPHPTAQQLPARLCMGRNCAQNRSCNTHCSDWHGLLCHPARGSQASSHRSHTWVWSLEDIKQGKVTKTTSLKPLLQVGHPSATATAKAASPFPSDGIVSYFLRRKLLLQSWRSHGGTAAPQPGDMVKPMPSPYPTLCQPGAHTEGQLPPIMPVALDKYSSLMSAPHTTTKTDSHLASVIANPTQALSMCNFASSASSPSQLLNPLPCNTILVLQPITKKHSYTKIPHPSYTSYFQVSFDAPNRSLAQVTIRSCSGINGILCIFSSLLQSNKLLGEASIRTSGYCPSPTVSGGASFQMPNAGIHLPFHGRGKAGSTSRQCAARWGSTRTKAKVWWGRAKHNPYLIMFVRRRALPSGWGTAAIKLLATIRRPL